MTKGEQIEEFRRKKLGEVFLDRIVQGYERKRCIALHKQYNVTETVASEVYYEVTYLLSRFQGVSLEEMITDHIGRYEKLYADAKSLKQNAIATRVLKEKERLSNFQSEVYVNLIESGVSFGASDSPYDFDQLTEDERKFLFETLELHNIDCENPDEVMPFQDAVDRQVFRNEDYGYYRFFLCALSQLENGIIVKDNWHIEYLCGRISEAALRVIKSEKRKKHISINIPFRTGKSLITNVFLNAWVWSIKPEMKFAAISSGPNVAEMLHEQFRSLIKSNWYQKLFGDKVQINPAVDSKQKINTISRGIRFSVGREVKITGSGWDCVTGDTIINTIDGDISIEELVNSKNEFYVKSFNIESGIEEYKKVTAKLDKGIRPVIEVHTKKGVLKCTKDHKIYTLNRGYVEAQNLTKNDIILYRYYHELVTNIIDNKEEANVFDIEVEDNHNFFANNVLVHNCLLFDDIQDASEGENASLLKKVNDSFQVYFTRLNNPDTGLIMNIQQRVGMGDMSSELQSEKKRELFDHIVIPGLYDPSVTEPKELIKYYGKNNSFYPTRFSYNYYTKESQIAMTNYSWNAQIMQKPITSDGKIFEIKQIEIIEPDIIIRNPVTSPMYFVIDSSYGDEDSGDDPDPTAIISCFVQDGILYITHSYAAIISFPDFTEALFEYVKSQGYGAGSMVYIEPKASGVPIYQHFRRHGDIVIKKVNSKFVSNSKKNKAIAVTPLIKQGKVKIICNEGLTKDPTSWVSKLIGELENFPSSSKSIHDDRVDTLVYAIATFLGIPGITVKEI